MIGLSPPAEINFRHARIARGLAGQPVENLLAVVQHDDALDDPHQHAHDVLDPNDRDAHPVADAREQVGGRSISAASRPPRLSSAKSSFGRVARARANSSFLSAAAPSPAVVAPPLVSPTRSSASSARRRASSRPILPASP